MNIIFVCTGNTCRSPMAEGYLKSKNLSDINVLSRGFSGGDTANEKSIAVMNEIGIDISNHVSKPITANDIKNTDKFICMTASHKRILLSLGAKEKDVFVLGDEIPDPYGFDIDVYRNCRDQITNEIDTLIKNGFFNKAEVLVASPDDVPDIAAIESECFTTPWSEGAILDSMNAKTHFYIAKVCGVAAGYMGVSIVCGEGYVTNIAVLPEFRNQGIAKQILNTVIKSHKNELEFISLEVRMSNDAAISLYKKIGFEVVGTRKRFYEHPVEDAYIMTKTFGD
ncbi:MAG: ribosomal protein S18-alanine N-acetyltransferase [Clostridia bacterium]|nr:ribosomal protein S18-alanine N-acetyltransferase [Clostridia bacterium]